GGIVDEDVDAAKLGLCLVPEPATIAVTGDVQRHGQDSPPKRANGSSCLLERPARAAIDRFLNPSADHHVGAVARELERYDLADAPAAAGDHGDFSLKRKRHS